MCPAAEVTKAEEDELQELKRKIPDVSSLYQVCKGRTCFALLGYPSCIQLFVVSVRI